MKSNLRARIVAEFLGTAFLVAAVVGSGIMAERLAGGSGAFALLANTIATGAGLVSLAVGSYITAVYWFTTSTSFANPAVTIARCLSGTFAGIRLADVPLFVVAQFAGGIAATVLFRWLVPSLPSAAKDVVVSHGAES